MCLLVFTGFPVGQGLASASGFRGNSGRHVGSVCHVVLASLMMAGQKRRRPRSIGRASIPLGTNTEISIVFLSCDEHRNITLPVQSDSDQRLLKVVEGSFATATHR